MSFKKLMLGTAAGGGSGWILEYDPSFSGTWALGSPVMSDDGTDDGNMYVAMGGGTDTDGVVVVKFDKDGTVLADKKISASAYYMYYPSMAVDSSENLYLITTQYINDANRFGIVKLNSSLAIQAQAYYGFGSEHAGSYHCIAARGSNLYVVTTFDVSTGRRPTGVVLSQSNLNVSSAHGFGSFGVNRNRGIKFDSSGNIIAHGNFRMSSSGDRYSFYKFGTNFSSNTIGREYAGHSGALSSMDVDGSNNMYTIGFCELGYPNTRDNLIAKLNSSGTAQWQVSLNLSGDNNSYGFISGSPNNYAMAIKKTSEGVVTIHQDQKNINSSYNDINISLFNESNGSLTESYGIACTSYQWQESINQAQLGALITDTHVYHHAKANGKYYILKLPIKDGSALYGNYTLNGVNFTIASNGASDQSADDDFSSSTSGPLSRSISKTNQSNWSASAVSVTPNKLDL